MDDETGRPLVDLILDEAQQKGTGKWMSQNAFDIGAPIPTVNAAVEARILSALKDERVGGEPRAARAGGRLLAAIARASSTRRGRRSTRARSRRTRRAWRCCGWRRRSTATTSTRARWRRSGGPAASSARTLLGDIRDAFRAHIRISSNLLLDDDVQRRDRRAAGGVARTSCRPPSALGIPVPAMSASLAYYDAYRSERLPANLTQAQRDFFGAHTYRRVDRDGVFHTRVDDESPT